MNALKKWRSGLMEPMAREINHQLRYVVGVEGSKGWRREKSKPAYVVKPTLRIMMDDKREAGRSWKYHTEVVDRMVALNEAGMGLWDSVEYGKADLEYFEGEELTAKERDFIDKLLAIRDAHLMVDGKTPQERTSEDYNQAIKRRTKREQLEYKADNGDENRDGSPHTGFKSFPATAKIRKETGSPATHYTYRNNGD